MSRIRTLVFLVMFVLTGAMGLKTAVTTHSNSVVIAANGGAPTPMPWKNGGAPTPMPWKNGGAPTPMPWKNGGAPTPMPW
jgi:hypothetical protein